MVGRDSVADSAQNNMTEPEPTTPKPQLRWFQHPVRTLLVVVFVTSIGVAGVVLCVKSVKWHRAYDDVELAILRLATIHPKDVPENRWAYCVWWTWELHGSYSYHFDTAQLRQFADDLNRKLDGPVGIDTIDWIWDEYLRYEPSTRQEADNRPTLPNPRSYLSEAEGRSCIERFTQKYERERNNR
jgi:hypothetical protein